MSLYDYECNECGEEVEHLATNPEDITECKCGGKLVRLYRGNPLLKWGKGLGNASFGFKRHFTQGHVKSKY